MTTTGQSHLFEPPASQMPCALCGGAKKLWNSKEGAFVPCGCANAVPSSAEALTGDTLPVGEARELLKLTRTVIREAKCPVCHAEGLPDPAENARGAHHAGGRDTEVKAAWKILPRSGTARAKCLDIIVRAGPYGATNHEIATATGLLLYTAAPRVTELIKGGWVKDSGDRRDSGNGADAIVWVLTEQALRELEVPAL